MPLMSKRAYARHREELGLPGSTHRAVQKAVEAGRISVTAGGLIDSDAADREWTANSSEGHRRGPDHGQAETARAARRPPVAPVPLRAPASAGPGEWTEPPPELPEGATAEPGMSLAEASALEKVWKAKLAELEFDEKSGKLVPAEDVRAKWVELVTLSKTKLLALPSKIKARIPSLSAADVGVIDGLIREALEELAKEDDESEVAAE
jgi:hypothetical protein